jgi:CcmD family protein
MRTPRSRWRAALLWFLLVTGPASTVPLAAQQPPKRPAQDEFVPLDELPPQEQLPAAPLLIAAYSVAWVAVAGYLFSIWRRMARVDHELAEIGRRVQERRPPIS